MAVPISVSPCPHHHVQVLVGGSGRLQALGAVGGPAVGQEGARGLVGPRPGDGPVPVEDVAPVTRHQRCGTERLRQTQPHTAPGTPARLPTGGLSRRGRAAWAGQPRSGLRESAFLEDLGSGPEPRPNPGVQTHPRAPKSWLGWGKRLQLRREGDGGMGTEVPVLGLQWPVWPRSSSALPKTRGRGLWKIAPSACEFTDPAVLKTASEGGSGTARHGMGQTRDSTA